VRWIFFLSHLFILLTLSTRVSILSYYWTRSYVSGVAWSAKEDNGTQKWKVSSYIGTQQLKKR